MEPELAFGRVLRRLRKAAGLSQEQFGFEAGVSRIYVSILELGQQQPSLSTIFKIARALNCRPGELLNLVEDELTKGRARS